LEKLQRFGKLFFVEVAQRLEACAGSAKWEVSAAVTMLLGYNTNGFAHHVLDDALHILAEFGYRSIALTLDYNALNPFASDFKKRLRQIKLLTERLRLKVVIETGARFLLDPRRKHRPSLIDPPRHAATRLDFLRRAVDIAAFLKSYLVSFWSGSADSGTKESIKWNRLVGSCSKLADYAEKMGVRLAFEPEPGMFIETMPGFAELHRRVGHPAFGLTLDVGHLHCMGETPITNHLQTWREWLWNIHIEDMRYGVHDHLMFGEGEIDFPPILQALQTIDYKAGIHVELSRHSHDALETARRAIQSH
jgi:sugar phosphate isomerase/epimerase